MEKHLKLALLMLFLLPLNFVLGQIETKERRLLIQVQDLNHNSIQNAKVKLDGKTLTYNNLLKAYEGPLFDSLNDFDAFYHDIEISAKGFNSLEREHMEFPMYQYGYYKHHTLKGNYIFSDWECFTLKNFKDICCSYETPYGYQKYIKYDTTKVGLIFNQAFVQQLEIDIYGIKKKLDSLGFNIVSEHGYSLTKYDGVENQTYTLTSFYGIILQHKENKGVSSLSEKIKTIRNWTYTQDIGLISNFYKNDSIFDVVGNFLNVEGKYNDTEKKIFDSKILEKYNIKYAGYRSPSYSNETYFGFELPENLGYKVFEMIEDIYKLDINIKCDLVSQDFLRTYTFKK